MKSFASFVFGLAGVLAGHWWGGLAWPCAAFLFFPISGLAGGLVDNDGKKLTRNGVMLLLFPIVVTAAPALSERFVAAMSKTTAIDRTVFSVVAVAVAFGVLFAVAHLVSRAVGSYELPSWFHALVGKIIIVSSFVLALGGAVGLLKFVDGNWLALTSGMKLVLTLVLVAAFCFGVRRALKADLSRVAEPPPAAGASDIVKPGSMRLVKRPSTTLKDVAGMADVKEQIRLRLIEPVRHAARAKHYGLKVGGGMLLYGPPGTGKTMLARAVAGELQLPFYTITAADVFGKYVGQSEGNIRRIFNEVRRHKLSVVFIDELETLFPKRDDDAHESTRKVISVILQELDGIDRNKNPILLIGATNVPWMVDEAFLRPGRFDVKTFVGLPDIEARRGILKKAFATGGVPCERGLVDHLAQITPNYTGADLNGVVSRMRQFAYDRRLSAYTCELAEEVVAKTSPSAVGDMLDKIQDWEAENLPENSSNSGGAGVRLAVRPTTTFDDVAGMEDAKEQIRLRLIEPTSNQKLAELYGIEAGGGVLLYGPPGTGKTFLASAVAGELKLPFYAVTAADVFGKHVGESERNVRKIFRDVRKNGLSVVFIDELEALAPKRTGEANDATRNVTSVLLQELDGIDRHKNPILLIGATNVPWMVDEAFLRPGRFDVKIFVGLPAFDARRQMFINALYRCKLPHEEGLTAYLAEHTEGYSGADLNGIMDRMRQVAYSRRLPEFTAALADEVLAASHPTECGEMLAHIKRWESGRE